MILYLHGDNSYGINRQVGLIKQKYQEATGSDGDMQNIDVAESGMGELLAGLAVVPMFVSSRLVVARNLAKAKPTPEQLDEIIDTTADSTNLVIIDPNPDKRTVLFKKLSKLKGAKEFKRPSRPELNKWIVSEAKKLEANISSVDANYLADLVGEDQWALSNELDKLANFNSDINKKTIDELATPSLENNTFVLTDALVRKDLPRVINLYNQLKLQGHADQMILGAIIYQYRSLMLAVLNDSELNSAYKMSPYSLSKARALAKDMDISDIKKAYKIIVDVDISIKTGDLPSGEAMKKLFYGLCK
jgi:DNA polymerase III delta subunit